jgi:hypothetical protein
MNKKISLLVMILGLGFFSFSNLVMADSYDLYVDANYNGDDKNGSKEKPFSTIEKALRKDGDKIYIKNGTYKEKLTLEKGVELYGEDKKKTIIQGELILKDKNTLKNLTIKGESEAIYIYGEADISNCIIRDSRKKGINIAEGKGLVKIKNTDFIKNGKGIYAQKGSYLNVIDSLFEGNSEEAIDMRDKIKGVISGNEIIGNGEGGIEIIIGSSDVLIKNNKIDKNKASGIATQFYSQASKTGKVEIKNNTITNNGKYGIVCKAPSGGSYEKDYWNKSIEIIENKIERNNLGAIDSHCRLIEAVTEEEEKQNIVIEVENETREKPMEKTAEEIAREIAEEEKIMLRLEKEKNMENLANETLLIWENKKGEIEKKLEEIKNENKFKIFFIGPNYSKINELEKAIIELREINENLMQNITEPENLASDEKKLEALKVKKELENFITSNLNSISESEKSFSLFGWLKKIILN